MWELRIIFKASGSPISHTKACARKGGSYVKWIRKREISQFFSSRMIYPRLEKKRVRSKISNWRRTKKRQIMMSLLKSWTANTQIKERMNVA